MILGFPSHCRERGTGHRKHGLFISLPEKSERRSCANDCAVWLARSVMMLYFLLLIDFRWNIGIDGGNQHRKH